MRKYYIITFVVAAIVLSIPKTYAQTDNTPLKTISAGVGISTLGIKVELATPLSEQLTLRAGVSSLPFNYTYKKVISAEKYRDKINYDPELKATANINFINANFLLDYAPFETNMFHFTAGMFIGKNTIDIKGALINPKTNANVLDDLRKNGHIVGDDLPTIEFDNKYEIQPSKDGTLSGKITIGNVVKPYLGIGIAPTIPNNKRIGVKLDAGMLYQGSPNITTPNMIRGDFNEWMKSYDQFNKISPILNWYPMINLQISFKITE